MNCRQTPRHHRRSSSCLNRREEERERERRRQAVCSSFALWRLEHFKEKERGREHEKEARGEPFYHRDHERRSDFPAYEISVEFPPKEARSPRAADRRAGSLSFVSSLSLYVHRDIHIHTELRKTIAPFRQTQTPRALLLLFISLLLSLWKKDACVSNSNKLSSYLYQ